MKRICRRLVQLGPAAACGRSERLALVSVLEEGARQRAPRLGPQWVGLRSSQRSLRGLDGRKSHRYGAWGRGTRWREYCSRLFHWINGPPGGAALKVTKTLSMIIAAAALQAACASAQPSRQGFTYVYGNLSVETGLGIERLGAAPYNGSDCSTSGERRRLGLGLVRTSPGGGHLHFRQRLPRSHLFDPRRRR